MSSNNENNNINAAEQSPKRASTTPYLDEMRGLKSEHGQSIYKIWVGFASMYHLLVRMLCEFESLEPQEGAYAVTMTTMLAPYIQNLKALHKSINEYGDTEACKELANSQPKKIVAPPENGKIFTDKASLPLVAQTFCMRLNYACQTLFHLRPMRDFPEDWNTADWDSSRTEYNRKKSERLMEFSEILKKAYISFKNFVPKVNAAVTAAKTDKASVQAEHAQQHKDELDECREKARKIEPKANNKRLEDLAYAIIATTRQYEGISDADIAIVAPALANARERVKTINARKMFQLGIALSESLYEVHEMKRERDPSIPADNRSVYERVAASLNNPHLVNREKEGVAFDPSIRKTVPMQGKPVAPAGNSWKDNKSPIAKQYKKESKEKEPEQDKPEEKDGFTPVRNRSRRAFVEESKESAEGEYVTVMLDIGGKMVPTKARIVGLEHQAAAAKGSR